MSTVQGCPPYYYALSGCNDINENGGYANGLGQIGDDGSEIFLNSSNILMDYGNNSIVDDRQESPPLYHTLLLMNGINVPVEFLARYNFWGTAPLSSRRFGNLSVTYEPTGNDGCPQPIMQPCTLIIPYVNDNDGALVEGDT